MSLMHFAFDSVSAVVFLFGEYNMRTVFVSIFYYLLFSVRLLIFVFGKE